MRKVFHFDSPADPYIADAAVLCCFDHRINRAVRKFLKKQGIQQPDMIVIAGGAKAPRLPAQRVRAGFHLRTSPHVDPTTPNQARARN